MPPTWASTLNQGRDVPVAHVRGRDGRKEGEDCHPEILKPTGNNKPMRVALIVMSSLYQVGLRVPHAGGCCAGRGFIYIEPHNMLLLHPPEHLRSCTLILQ